MTNAACQSCYRAQSGVSFAEIARRAGVDSAVARRAILEGVFPMRDKKAAERLQRVLAEIRSQNTEVRGQEPRPTATPLQTPGSFGFAATATPFVKGGKASHLSSAPRKKTPDVEISGVSPATPFPNEQEDSMLLRFESLTQVARRQFALARPPFSDDIHSKDDVFISPALRYVRAALLDAAVNHGFIALVGESGSGKSTLAEELEQKILDEGRPVIIIRPYVLAMEENDAKGKTLKSSAIAEAIIRTLDPSASPRRTADARFRQTHELLKASRAAGNAHLILIEEAHCLPIATLKHLKRFLELKQGLSRLVGVCLVGQPELMNRLSEHKPEVREVAQRCEILPVPPLDGDLEAYLDHKFKRAGAKVADVLAPDAAEAIRQRLIRIPRGGKARDAESLCYPLVVGNLVTRAMNAAAATGWAKIDAQVIGGC